MPQLPEPQAPRRAPRRAPGAAPADAVDAELPPAPAWAPVPGRTPVTTDDDAAVPRLAAIAAKWSPVAQRAASLPPARCDVCGAVETLLPSGRTALECDVTVHDRAARRAEALVDPTTGGPARPRRVGDDDDDAAPPPPVARAQFPRALRAYAESDDA